MSMIYLKNLTWPYHLRINLILYCFFFVFCFVLTAYHFNRVIAVVVIGRRLQQKNKYTNYAR